MKDKIVFTGGKPIELNEAGKAVHGLNKTLAERVVAPVPPDGFVILPDEEYRDAIEGYPASGRLMFTLSQIFIVFYLFYFTLKYISSKIFGIYVRRQIIFTTKRLIFKNEYYFLKKIIRLQTRSVPLSAVNETTYNMGRNVYLVLFSILSLINTGLWVVILLGPASTTADAIIMGLNLAFMVLFYFTYLISTRTHLFIRYQGGKMGLFHWGESEFLTAFNDRLQMTITSIYAGNPASNSILDTTTKKECPHCGKQIPEAAIKCKFCKTYLS